MIPGGAMMRITLLAAGLLAVIPLRATADDVALLPGNVKAVWDLDRAYREATPTRERVCVNGLWRWQPAQGGELRVPEGSWGFFKVPGCWPGITDYLQKDSQTLYPHPDWAQVKLSEVRSAWHQRQITVPAEWTGRQIVISAEYLNSRAVVFVDGRKAGTMQFPAGEVDVTDLCPPGSSHLLSLYVTALPLKAVMASFGDSATEKQVEGSVERRGLCGDVYLVSRPAETRIDDVKLDTSVRHGTITFAAATRGLKPGARYTLRAAITGGGRTVATFDRPFTADDLRDGRLTFSEKWKPDRLWDLHTPANQCRATLSLLDAAGSPLDVTLAQPFGFREFWIDGRDFYLNGTRIYLSALPLDNAQVGAAWASYEAAKESLLRLKGIGINSVYTHNYGCEPGTHLSFTEVLRAADDVGMLVALSQPHFGQYDWQAAGADEGNGYAAHARFYASVAGSHPSVVMYSMSHNATGYAEDMNPDKIDGLPTSGARDSWASNNSKKALRAEAIVRKLDPTRIVYHHAGGNIGSMHTSNFYTNMAPAQELDDWFGHWAEAGVKPLFTCEYMVPCTWDWTMYRGWYKGKREFGGARVPWEFCVAEWSAQFLGDRAYAIGEPEKRNIRWEAEQFRAGRLWHRWDYPSPVGSTVFDTQHEVIGRYLTTNWRSFRTWGVSGVSPWEYHFYWTLRPGADASRKQLPVDWDHLQRPGFSADYLDPYQRIDLGFERSDWTPTDDGRAILRNNMAQLAYVAGKPSAFTSKDHNFAAGETVEKQLVVINNSRQTVTCDYQWSLNLPQPLDGAGRITVPTGDQQRVALKLDLPGNLPPGRYDLRATFRFPNGLEQEDAFAFNVLPRPAEVRGGARVALFDPRGETARMLSAMHVAHTRVEADADLAGFDVLVVGKGALTLDGPGPRIGRVRDGLRVLVFEQTARVLERRLGFRVAEYGLRQVFKRVPDHPALAGMDAEHLRDWRGESTTEPPRLDVQLSPRFNGAPAVKWCDIEVSRVWRCGNRGNVASALIEKPARGDFLPLLDGGFSLQYSPLIEYRQGLGSVLFCQLDVTGRTEADPAAQRVVHNLLAYVCDPISPKATPDRTAVYVGDPAGRRALDAAGVSVTAYEPGKLSPDQVLIAGPGAGKALAADAAAVGDFLKAGGRVLALGLDEQDANSVLPFKTAMKSAEHIAASFEPPSVRSLLAGVGPADVHNRDPRTIPLVTSGATIVGDGVLAENGGVVFFQLPPRAPPDDAGEHLNVRRTSRRTAVALARLLGNLRVHADTPLLSRFEQPAKDGDARWRQGLYVDQPIDWDDPYRFFRW
jgi:hypothetical protein